MLTENWHVIDTNHSIEDTFGQIEGILDNK